MDSLKDLLLAKDLDQPSEMKAVQEYLEKHLGHSFTVTDYPQHMTIAVENGKIGYQIRAMMSDLKAYAAPTKDIRVRIDPSVGHKQ